MNQNADEGVPIPEDPLTTLTVAESLTPLAQTTAAQSALHGSKQRLRWQSLSSVTTLNSTGELIATHPFLEKRLNWADIKLV